MVYFCTLAPFVSIFTNVSVFILFFLFVYISLKDIKIFLIICTGILNILVLLKSTENIKTSMFSNEILVSVFLYLTKVLGITNIYSN